MPRRKNRSVALLSMLLSLVIISILMGMYFSPVAAPRGGTTPWAISRIDRARDVTCQANRRTLQTDLVQAQIDHGTNLSAAQLATALRRSARCPGGGVYFAVPGGGADEIYCTLHADTPKFIELLMGG